jgi:hypothetical protein
MKKYILLFSLAACLMWSSCATICCGPITDCQRTAPAPGTAPRALRPGALVFDILLTGLVGVAIDFATCAIYKPCATAGVVNYQRIQK